MSKAAAVSKTWQFLESLLFAYDPWMGAGWKEWIFRPESYPLNLCKCNAAHLPGIPQRLAPFPQKIACKFSSIQRSELAVALTASGMTYGHPIAPELKWT